MRCRSPISRTSPSRPRSGSVSRRRTAKARPNTAPHSPSLRHGGSWLAGARQPPDRLVGRCSLSRVSFDRHLATEERSFVPHRRAFCVRRLLTLRNPTSWVRGVNGRVGWQAEEL